MGGGGGGGGGGVWPPAPPLPTPMRTVELQWLEHVRNHANMFKTRVVRANDS